MYESGQRPVERICRKGRKQDPYDRPKQWEEQPGDQAAAKQHLNERSDAAQISRY
jgi:hypothetical protein